MRAMTVEVNQRGFQITSRDRELHERGALGKFLDFLAETASTSNKPEQVIETGVQVIREASKVVKP